MNWQLPDTMTVACAVLSKAAVANVAGTNVVANVVVVDVVKAGFIADVALVVAIKEEPQVIFGPEWRLYIYEKDILGLQIILIISCELTITWYNDWNLCSGY